MKGSLSAFPSAVLTATRVFLPNSKPAVIKLTVTRRTIALLVTELGMLVGAAVLVAQKPPQPECSTSCIASDSAPEEQHHTRRHR